MGMFGQATSPGASTNCHIVSNVRWGPEGVVLTMSRNCAASSDGGVSVTPGWPHGHSTIGSRGPGQSEKDLGLAIILTTRSRNDPSTSQA